MAAPDLARFIDDGVAMLAASRGDDLVPEAVRAWGASVGADGRLRVLVGSDGGRTFDNLQGNAHLAVTFTCIETFRSLQVKGVVAGVEPPGPGDAAVVRRYTEQFRAKLVGVGHPPTLADRLRPPALFAVSLAVDALFDQTPGPEAGGPLDRVGGP